MKHEDFKIEGIPDGYRVYDVDLTPSGRPVVGIAHLNDQTAPAILTGTGSSVVIPDDLLWPRRDGIGKPRVRAAGEALVVAQRVRARHDTERTAWIWTADGQFVSSFAGGDDCMELLADRDHLLLFYGDEAPGGGMCVCSTEGVRMWSQAEEFPEARISWWFHAAAWAAPDDAAIWADVQREGAELNCAYVRLNVRERSQRVFSPPPGWSGPRAITAAGNQVMVHGTVRPWMVRGDEATPSDQIIEWTPGEESWRVVGRWPFEVTTTYRPLRGLPGGRFIAVQPDGYTILSFD